MKIRFVGLCFVMALMWASASRAELLLYEGFDYGAPDADPYAGRSIGGKSGGQGWAGPWNVRPERHDWGLGEGLRYGRLDVAGGAAYVEAHAPAGAWGELTRKYPALPTDAGKVYWMSYLVRMSGVVAGDQKWCGIKWNWTGLWAGKNWNANFFGMELPPAVSGRPLLNDQIVLVVMRVAYTQTTMDKHLWINPADETLGGSDLPLETADLAQTNLAKEMPDGNLVLDSIVRSAIDEIRTGTTYASVTPVKKPALLLFGQAGGKTPAVAAR